MLIFSKINLIGSLTFVKYKVRELFIIRFIWASGIFNKYPFLGFDRFRMAKKYLYNLNEYLFLARFD